MIVRVSVDKLGPGMIVHKREGDADYFDRPWTVDSVALGMSSDEAFTAKSHPLTEYRVVRFTNNNIVVFGNHEYVAVEVVAVIEPRQVGS